MHCAVQVMSDFWYIVSFGIEIVSSRCIYSIEVYITLWLQKDFPCPSSSVLKFYSKSLFITFRKRPLKTWR